MNTFVHIVCDLPIWLCLEIIAIEFLQAMLEQNDIFGELYDIIIERKIQM